MPLYRYRCTNCHAPRERRVPVDERDEQFCHPCGNHLTREFGRPHVAAIAGIYNRIGAEIEGREHYA